MGRGTTLAVSALTIISTVLYVSSQMTWHEPLTYRHRGGQKSVRRVIYRDYYQIPEDDMLWMHLGE